MLQNRTVLFARNTPPFAPAAPQPTTASPFMRIIPIRTGTEPQFEYGESDIGIPDTGMYQRVTELRRIRPNRSTCSNPGEFRDHRGSEITPGTPPMHALRHYVDHLTMSGTTGPGTKLVHNEKLVGNPLP